MANEANTRTKRGTRRTVTIDGSLKTMPDRLDGWTVEFPAIPQDASASDALAIVLENSENNAAAAELLRSAFHDAQEKDLKSFINAKAREDGKTYTREEIKALPQRSAVVSREEFQAFGADWNVPAPKVTPAKAAAAAEEKARRTEAALNAAHEALLDTIRALPKKDQEAKLDEFVAAGILPEGTTL